MNILKRNKSAAKKGTVVTTKSTTQKSTKKAAPRTKSLRELVLSQYNKGSNFQELADKHNVTVEKVQSIVEEDQAKNEPKE